MTATLTAAPAAYTPRTGLAPTERQLSYVLALAGKHLVPAWGTCAEERIEALGASIENTRANRADVSKMIDWLKGQPEAPSEAPVQETTQAEAFDSDTLTTGAYRRDGELYIVKPNRERTHMYAMRAFCPASPRLNKKGQEIWLDFAYERGAVRKLRPEHKLSPAETEAVSKQFGACLICGHYIEVAASLKRGVGPVCWKNIGGTGQAQTLIG